MIALRVFPWILLGAITFAGCLGAAENEDVTPGTRELAEPTLDPDATQDGATQSEATTEGEGGEAGESGQAGEGGSGCSNTSISVGGGNCESGGSGNETEDG